jgi:methylisocitrate lyase
MYLSGRGGLAGLGMTLADLGELGYRIVADPSTPLLAAYEAWKKIYADLAGAFGAGTPARGWAPVERETLGVIDLEKLLAIERATVEK